MSEREKDAYVRAMRDRVGEGYWFNSGTSYRRSDGRSTTIYFLDARHTHKEKERSGRMSTHLKIWRRSAPKPAQVMHWVDWHAKHRIENPEWTSK